MNRNQNSEALILLCSHLGASKSVVPLEPSEWNQLVLKLSQCGMTPGDLLNINREALASMLNLDEQQAERLLRLLDRSASLSFEISRYEEMGIDIVTREDANYPGKLKARLKDGCPPLFYYAGELSLLESPVIGFVGSRAVDQSDFQFTEAAVTRIAQRGFGVASGGAKGIDSIAATAGMKEGIPVIEFLADSMLRKMRESALTRLVRDGQALLMTAFNPDAGFHVGNAMARNRQIYAQSEGTVVVRSDLKKGGTWAGATENLKKRWCLTLCRDINYPGNQELIRMGATPVQDDWDGTIPAMPEAPAKPQSSFEQISLFEL